MGRGLRLLFLGLDWRPVGGLEIYNRYLAQAFTAAGCRVDAWGVFNTAPVPLDSGQALPLAPGSRPGMSLYARYAWRRLLRWRLTRALSRYDLAVVGHVSLLPSVHSAWLGCGRRPPYWVWTYGREAWSAPETLAPALLAAQCIGAISSYTAEMVRQKLSRPAPFFVAPNPVDTERFKPAAVTKNDQRRVLLTVGRLASSVRYKGHEVVMQALPLAKGRLKAPLLYRIVGDGDDRAYLQSLAKGLGVADCVEFTGRLSFAELVQAYQACDVFVMPSRVEQKADGSWSGEGFGSVYIEAAACGRPVIASNQGGASEAIRHGETGFAVDPTSPEAVADAASALLGDRGMAERMGQAGRRFVEDNFAVPVFQRRVADMLRAQGF